MSTANMSTTSHQSTNHPQSKQPNLQTKPPAVDPALLKRLVKESHKKITELEAEVASLQQRQHEPIAIIGMGCRFPGTESPAAYWHFLRNGDCAIRDVPQQRWEPAAYADLAAPTVPQAAWCRGGFLDQVDQFDPVFFRIAPAEARSMDPQQRLLLEVAWEALEHAAIAPDQLMGSRSGIFVGIAAGQQQVPSAMVQSEQALYIGTGSMPSMAAGRLAYLLGVQGPCAAVDTSCSSVLMAVHNAVGSLRNGMCDLALAGGVNVLTPEANLLIANSGILAADGHCKSFDQAADGHARSEGCGMVVLKRLRDAVADGDQIWAVIRGSACNHDGRTSGLTAPNGLAQQAVIREALADGGISAEAVSYSEAHATGTSLGDTIEINALAAVYAERQEPLLVGSVKPNLGHLEWASGASSLFKLILALYHGEIPPHIGIKQLNPTIAWDELPVRVVTERTSWPQNPATTERIGGVSGFGFSGTNVHLILSAPPVFVPVEGAPEPVSQEPAVMHSRTHEILTLSAKSEAALQALAERYAQHLAAHPALSIADLCFTANTGRNHLSHRLSLINQQPAADAAQEFSEKLAAFAGGQRPMGLFHGQVPTARPKVAFLFSGLGGQQPEMGRQLYETQPIFRQAVDSCDQILRSLLGESVTALLYAAADEREAAASKLQSTRFAEAALFMVEYALAQLWQAWGVKADLLVGHSLGEYVAACVAGVFTLADALKLVVARAQLVEEASSRGATAAILGDEATVKALLAPYGQAVSLAGINSPTETLVAGEATAVAAVLDAATAAGIDGRQLSVAHAAHSPLMAPILARFEEVARSVTYRPPRTKILSSVTGELCRELDAAYWCRHLREPVQFAAAIQQLQGMECRLMLEVGPQPVLLWLGRQNWAETSPEVQWLPSLWSVHADWKQMLLTLGVFYVQGVDVDWQAVERPLVGAEVRRKVVLPTYPFQRQRYWMDIPAPLSQTTTAISPMPFQAKAGDSAAVELQNGHPDAAGVPSTMPASPATLSTIQLQHATPAERQRMLLQFVREQVSAILYLEQALVLPESNLVEFGMDSVMAMNILNACREVVGFVLYPRDLYERPVINHFARYLAEEFDRLQGEAVEQSATENQSDVRNPLMRIIPPTFVIPEQKNPPMLFVLSAPRSGSTLLRVMLAGHPALFAPPELHLLWLEQMREFPQLDYLGEGLQRTLMALHGLDATAAQAMIDQWVAENCSAQEVYRRLQAAAAPKILVDKSPTYGGHLHVLQRIEQLFEQPKVLHLVRHPYAMVDSFVRNRMDRIGGYGGLDAFAVAEQVWVDSNRHIHALLATFPAEQQFTIRYEDLVRNAPEQMAQISDWLAVPFAEAMVHPYEGERMTDGVHAGSIPLGDMNFAQHDAVKPELADAWRTIQLPRPLGQEAQELATTFGYELPAALASTQPQAATAHKNSTVAQNGTGSSTASANGNATDFPMQSSYLDVRGLSLAICTWGPEAGPPVVCLHGLLDQGASWNEVAVALAQQGYRVIAPDLRGHGWSEHVGAGCSYQFMDFIGDVDALLQRLALAPVTLMGHSLGATLSAVYAAARPDRVARLLLVEPYVPTAGRRPDLVEQIATRLDYFSAALQHTVLADVQVAAQQLRLTAPRMAATLAQRLAERLTKPAEHGTPGVIWRWDPQLKSRQIDTALGQEMDQAAYLALLQRIQTEIEASVVVIYGQESDRQSPAAKQWLAQELPNVEVVEVVGGHNLHVEAPCEVANILIGPHSLERLC